MGIVAGFSSRKIFRRSIGLCVVSRIPCVFGVPGRLVWRHCIRISVSLLGSQHDKLISKRRLSPRSVVLTRITERCTTVQMRGDSFSYTSTFSISF